MNEEVRQTPGVRTVTIDDSQATQRIDNFLIARLKGVPKSRIYRMLRKGEVRVNKRRIRAEYRLCPGDVVRIPPVRVAVRESVEIPVRVASRKLDARVLYEDRDLLILNKPFGMAVHGGSGLSYGLIEALRCIRSEDRFLELAHRLDRDTSGCLLVARKRSILKQLHELFRSDQVRKRYSVLLCGSMERKNMIIDAALRKQVKKSGEWLVEVSDSGKASRTRFVTRKKFSAATLVDAHPKTGRTHQIRVHAAFMGCPVAGDERYGDRETNRRFRKSGLRRLFLHASSLEFRHPGSGEVLTVHAPLETELSEVIKRLENEEND